MVAWVLYRQSMLFERSGIRVEKVAIIGEGSFGSVYSAFDSQSGKMYALKEVSAPNRLGLIQVESEINVLFSLKRVTDKVSEIIDFEIQSFHTGGFKASILMSLVSGIPLDQFLSSASLSAAQRLSLAVGFVDQLTPVLRAIDSICCHRDLTPHNILVNLDGAGNPLFTLIDFGLAIDRNEWALYKWRDAPLGGDCRFWPACAWRMLLHGWSSLAEKPITADQYRDKLDMHSFALSIMSILCSGNEEAGTLGALNNAWKKYVTMSHECWRVFFACFKDQGDWSVCKKKLDTEMHVIKCTTNALRGIKRELRNLREAHAIFAFLERMLLVEESSITGSWRYFTKKLPSLRNISGKDNQSSSPEPSLILRCHY